MKRYWCLCSSRENWQICRAHSVFGFDWRYLPTLERFVNAGDEAIVYVTGGAFVATAEITGGWFEDHTPIGWTKASRPYAFPVRIPIRITSQGRAGVAWTIDHDENRLRGRRDNLLNAIEFIADKGKTWNQYVQVSLVRITSADYDTVAGAISDSRLQS